MGWNNTELPASTVKRLLFERGKKRPCADCHVQYAPHIMQYDHLRDKTFTLAAYTRRGISKADLEAEIAKCEVVCANCHAERTHLRKAQKRGVDIAA